MKFNVGDRVECVNVGKIYDSICGNLMLGSIYTVKTFYKPFGKGRLELEECGGSPYSERFKKVSTNQPKTTKKEESKMNKIIKDTFKKETSEVAQVINDEFGDEVSNTFGAAPKLGAMFVGDHKVEMIDHANKVIADAKAAAEKAAKEA